MVHKIIKPETIEGRKVWLGIGITPNEKAILREFVKENRGEGDWHFWKSDNKIKFQQLIGKEYFGWVYEFTNLEKKQFKTVG